jgi:hypothetical protein
MQSAEGLCDHPGWNNYAQYVGMIGDGELRLAYEFFQRVVEPVRSEPHLLEDRADAPTLEPAQIAQASEPKFVRPDSR